MTYKGKNYSVTAISDWAFSGCRNLTSINIPSSVESIGRGAFYGCQNLTSLTIPSGVTSIDTYEWFHYCSNLASVKVDAGNPVYDSRDNCNAIIETSTNTLIWGCKNATIPSSVTSIGEGAFYHRLGLTSINIPEGVTSIADNAFGNCTDLKNITIPEGVTRIGVVAFYGCHSLLDITIPSSVTEIGKEAFDYCSALASIKVNAGNPKYDSRDNCNAIIETKTNTIIKGCKNTIIPKGVKSIGLYAFVKCSGLTSIHIPSNLISINMWAFMSCRDLTSITFSSGIRYIGAEAFAVCTSLKNITIPEGVTSLANNVFYRCTDLTSIVIPSSVGYIAGTAFSRCSKLEKIYALSLSPAEVNCSFADLTTSEKIYNTTLYVKKGLKKAYAAAEGWNKFNTIVEMSDEQYEELIKSVTYKDEEDEKEEEKEEEKQEEKIVNASVTLSPAGYATFYSDSHNFKMPAGLSALVIESGQNISYKTIASGDANGIIPKGVPVVLTSNNKTGGTYALTSTTESASYSGENLLRGSSLQTMTSNANGVSTSGNSNYVYYKLTYGKSGSANANKFGWYWGTNNGASFSIAGGKAWLALPKTSAQSLDAVLMIDDEATSIDDIEQDSINEANNAQYNITGQRVGNAYNGIIIVNGKKVIR